MDLNLEGRVIIITGGTQGIGRAVVKLVAEEGGIPVFIGRTKSNGEELRDELKAGGRQCHFIRMDLNDAHACQQAAGETIGLFGRIDGLVNNAGANDGIGLEKGSPEAFQLSVDQNLTHYYTMAHACLPALKKSTGAIVNVSSKTAMTGQGGTSGYTAAKGAQLALTREWAVELLPFRIRVNAVIPAEVWTPQYERWIGTFEQPGEALEAITKKIPLGKRMTTPEEIANMVVFLLSERSSHTTGQWIIVDGGYTHLDRKVE